MGSLVVLILNWNLLQAVVDHALAFVHDRLNALHYLPLVVG